MLIVGCRRVTVVALAFTALGLGGCLRHEVPVTGIATGSIKDTLATAPPRRPVARVAARPARATKAEVATAVESPASAPPPVRASESPAAPPPSVERVTTASPQRAVPAAPAAPPAAPAAEPPLPPVEEPAAVRALLAEGLALFEAGKVVQARRRFIGAMNGPVPEVLLALARSYDTYYLSVSVCSRLRPQPLVDLRRIS